MARHLLARSALFASLVLALSLGAPSHVGVPGAGIALAAHARPMRNGKLAFVDRGKYNAFYRIAVFNPDGSVLRGLTPPCTQIGCFMSYPTWSPDGAYLAFFGQTATRNGGNTSSLFVISSNGGGEKLLAHCGGGDCGHWAHSRPSWSPDGSRIIFRQRGWLAIVNAYTSTLHRVTSCTVPFSSRGRPATTGCSDSNPSWSPDGSHIIFSRTLNSRHTSGGNTS